MPDEKVQSNSGRTAGQREAPPGGPGVVAARNSRVPDPGQRGIASGGLGGEADPAGTRLGGKAVPVMPGEARPAGDAPMPTTPAGAEGASLGGAPTNDAMPGGGNASDDQKLPNQR